ncbi:MAG: CHRD domain-containing protein [Bacteroidia bacterium]|nr:CHRD domain-containing protein [Bacteroidia bacterium]
MNKTQLLLLKNRVLKQIPALLLIFFFSGMTAIAQTQFVAKLSGNQSTFPILTTGKGEVTATLTGTELVVTGSFSGLVSDFNPNVAGGAHFHQGYAGRNGGIQIHLHTELDANLRGGTFPADSNTFTLTQAQIDALNSRQLYVNIHTAKYASGEIRGQLLPASDDYFSSRMFGSNSVPAVMSDGQGSLVLELTGNQLVVTGSFNNLTGDFNPAVAGGSHFHKGLAGENGGIQIELVPTPDANLKGGIFVADSNTFTLTQEQLDLLNGRGLYTNIHTTTVASGEIRGQVLPMPQIVFRTHLSGSNETTPLTVRGTGQTILEYKDSTLTVSGTFQNLGSPLNGAIAGGAHIHTNIAGRNGGISYHLHTELDTTGKFGRFEADSNSFAVSAAQLQNLMSRRMYANIHTAINPSGELRGQVLPQSQFVMNGFLSGINDVSPRISTGMGSLKAEILGNQMIVTGSFNNLQGDFNPAVAGGSHLHFGLAGSNGGIAIHLHPTLDANGKGGIFEADSNTITLSAGMRDTLKSRMLYANIHTTLYPPGEVRGQLLHEATSYFVAPLSGTSSTTPVKTNGTGAVNIEWTGTRLIATGSFNNLNTEFNHNVAGGAHIHVGYPGRNGSIQLPLEATVDTSGFSGQFLAVDNTLTARSGQIDSLFNRLFYVNIHTTANPSGEIRGTLLPFAATYFTAHAKADNELSVLSSPGHGAIKLSLTGSNLVVTGSFNALTLNYTASHLHIGANGTNGGVKIGLKPTVDPDQFGGVYQADSNRYVLDSAQIADIRSGNYYWNVHSAANPPGELRGQVLPETNFFPNDDAVITTPADGALIEIVGPEDSVFTADWSAASDPDNDLITYIWELALDSAFTQMITREKVRINQTFSTTFEVIDSLLALNGVNIGDTVTLYHRALSLDGNVSTPGMGASVQLIRSGLTGLDELIFDQFTLSFFPSPVQDVAHLVIESQIHTRATLRVMDMAGRTVSSREVVIGSGHNDLEIDFSQLGSGVYFVKLEQTAVALPALKVLKK